MEEFWTVRTPGRIGIVAAGVRARFLPGSARVAVVELPGECGRAPGPGAVLVLESARGRRLLSCIWTEAVPRGIRCVCTA